MILVRISGLDPAGPLYQGIDEDTRLSEDNGTFVDVIHTNQKALGYYGSCGTVDFYINCETHQPGRIEITSEDSGSILLVLPVEVGKLRGKTCVDNISRLFYFNFLQSLTCSSVLHREHFFR